MRWESHPTGTPGFQNPKRNSLGLFSLELGGATFPRLPVKNWFGWELGWAPLDPGIALGHFLQHWGLRAGQDPLDFGGVTSAGIGMAQLVLCLPSFNLDQLIPAPPARRAGHSAWPGAGSVSPGVP